MLTWSTTVADGTSVHVTLDGSTGASGEPVAWTAASTEHAVTLTGLEANTSYIATLAANDTQSVEVSFTTSDVVDETAPEILNLAAEVLEDGRVVVSWYTSESATERVVLNDDVLHEDLFATKKNHAFTTEALGDGTYTVEVVSADASGNVNQSTLSFNVEAGADVQDPDTNEDPATTDDETQPSQASSVTLQIAALVVVGLVLLAFIRVRNHGPDGDDPWQ